MMYIRGVRWAAWEAVVLRSGTEVQGWQLSGHEPTTGDTQKAIVVAHGEPDRD